MDLADIFSTDLNTSLEAVSVLPDDDLFFAALIINTQPIQFGKGAEDTAAKLAQLCAHARTEPWAAQIAHAAFENARPWFIVRALAYATGLDSIEVEAQYKAGNGYDMVGAHVNHIAALPHGQVFIHEAMHAEYRHVIAGRQTHDDHTLLMRLVRHATDSNALQSYMLGAGRKVAFEVLQRFVELGSQTQIDKIALNPGGYFHTDQGPRLAIANASKSVVEELASRENFSFIYRRAALERLTDTEVTDVAANSAHENVRNSANEVLSARGLVPA
jgi:3-dehydroquinate dehydratase